MSTRSSQDVQKLGFVVVRKLNGPGVKVGPVVLNTLINSVACYIRCHRCKNIRIRISLSKKVWIVCKKRNSVSQTGL